MQIKAEDVKVETYCPRSFDAAGFPGYSGFETGIKLTHVPTGCVALYHSERSAHANKAKAWALLEETVAKPSKPEVEAEEPTEEECQERIVEGWEAAIVTGVKLGVRVRDIMYILKAYEDVISKND